MTMDDDDILQQYVEEAQEHLADIEKDLLAIEQAGADIDEAIVNKVFRAAHSLKGGAGFMGLTNIKDLAHKMEGVLGLIRSREMIPSPEIVNVLLLSFDKLHELVTNVENSNDIDISEHVEALTRLANAALPEEKKVSVSKMVDICLPDGKAVFAISEFDLSRARQGGRHLYLVEYDLIGDVERKGKTPLEVLTAIQKSGIILECKIDMSEVGVLEDDAFSKRLPFMVLFATIIEPDIVGGLFEVDDKCIHPITEAVPAKPPTTRAPDSAPADRKVSVDEESAEGGKETGSKPEFQKRGPEKRPEVAAAVQAETSLRVNVGLLDSLMNLAGELVLSRNQLLQIIGSGERHALELVSQRIDMVTSEVQEAVMRTRMQPIGNVLNKFPRVVRDLTRDLGKEVNFTIEGKEVELDKTLIEAINDPLTHLVRNAVDHGIEHPDIRRQKGKNPVGQIKLKAYHEAGQVNIEIADDGKGMDGVKLAASAVKKGLITKEQAMTMSNKEKVSLIFLAGFSTADKVTDVSGRGVGMDVVKTNLDRLGGVVDIDSVPEEGATIRIKLPLTLAIIPSQIISAGGERYAIAQVNLDELLRIPASEVKDRIEKVGDAEVVRLRGRLLPLIRLADVLGMERTYIDPADGQKKPDRRKNIADRRSSVSPLIEDDSLNGEQALQGVRVSRASNLKAEGSQFTIRRLEDRRYHANSAVNIVVVSAGAFEYGLVVDELHDSEEIVVKPLGRHIKHCRGYAGATIMGDGRVALILDVPGLAHMAKLTSMEGTGRAAQVAQEAAEATKATEDVQSLLVFRNAEDEQFAVPLALVARIEKIKQADIEQVGGKRVIQYRGASLPLFTIEEVAKVKPLADKQDLIAIVFTLTGKEVGLLATGPVDAIETAITIDDVILKQPGITGSAIIGDRTTLMVDIFGLTEALNPQWFQERNVRREDGETATILLVEDTNYFRNQAKEFIEDGGYNVIEAQDGMIAWKLLQEHGEKISLVVTDIEMPNLDGFALTRKIKKDPRYARLPVIAVTALAEDEDKAKGKAAGIDDYQVKVNKEKLLESIYKHLKKGK